MRASENPGGLLGFNRPGEGRASGTSLLFRRLLSAATEEGNGAIASALAKRRYRRRSRMVKMTNKRRAHQILWIECIGFLLIILLSWLDEIVQLPRLIFGGAALPNWRESAMESLVFDTSFM